MRLTAGKRVLMFIHWLLSLLLFVVVTMFACKPDYLTGLYNTVAGKLNSSQLMILGIALLALYVIFTVIQICIIFGQGKRDDRGFITVVSSDSGRVRIAVSAIEHMVRHSVTNIDGIDDMKIDIENQDDAIAVNIASVLKNGVHVPTITMNMQQAIRKFVEMNCGVAVRSVSVNVNAVSGNAEGLRRRNRKANADVTPDYYTQTSAETPVSSATEDEARVSPVTEAEAPTSPETKDEAPTSPMAEDEAPVSVKAEDEAPVSPVTEDEAIVSVEAEDEAPVSPVTEDEAPASVEAEDEAPVHDLAEAELPEVDDQEKASVIASEDEEEIIPLSEETDAQVEKDGDSDTLAEPRPIQLHLDYVPARDSDGTKPSDASEGFRFVNDEPVDSNTEDDASETPVTTFDEETESPKSLFYDGSEPDIDLDDLADDAISKLKLDEDDRFHKGSY